MDASTFANLVLACAPLVHPSTAQALVAVESSFNPYAIGVVGGVLDRQPRHRAEAKATVDDLAAKGWNFSAGIAQINSRNFRRLGLNRETVFDACENLRAMQVVLGECFSRALPQAPEQAALRMALSCYYSGNFATGFDHGYVQRVTHVPSPQQGARARRP
jgi:type IV secretion system protein VirB1